MTITRVEHIVRELEQLIAQSPAETRLGNKREICERFDVAPGTLNQAIRLLQSRGSVSVRPGPRGGIFTAKPRPLELLSRAALDIGESKLLYLDALRVRRALDPVLIGDTIEQVSSEQVQRITIILGELREAAEAGDSERFAEASWRFQHAVYELSTFEFSRSVLDAAIGIQREFRPNPYAASEDLLEIYEHHARLWRAIEARDLEQARGVVSEAIDRFE